ncbi:MAG: DUF5312 family protein [Spirochaetaceae bacterium]|jgi:hypothetical protein|nr:DUF5312 family protein [Spirochaetaceae bacterium]
MTFRELLNLLFGNERDSVKRSKNIKSLVKDIKGCRYKIFYSVFSRKATPHMAAYFYELYRDCSALNIKNIEGTARLKNAVIRHFIDNNTREVIKQLDDKYLTEQFKNGDMKALSKQTEKNIRYMHNKFDEGYQDNIDQCYNLICSFIGLVNFDYYSLLINFSSRLTEESLHSGAVKRFYGVKAEKIVEDLKDFLVVAERINIKDDWKTAFTVLNSLNRETNIRFEHWMYILKKLDHILSSTILEMVIRHASYDFGWKNTIKLKHEKIARIFLSGVTKNAHKTVQDIMVVEKANSLSTATSFIFGNVNIQGAQFYTETWNEANKVNSVTRFKYAVAFNYCIVFMMMFFEKIKSICNSCIIYGTWVDLENMHILSEVLHDITVVSLKLPAYDLSLSDLGEHGSKLKVLNNTLIRNGKETDRNRLARYIDSINDEIFVMIHDVIYNLGYINVFLLTEFEDEKTEKKIVNIKELSKSLSEEGCDVLEIKEKLVAFLNLLEFLEFESRYDDETAMNSFGP